jgi:ribonuclease D
VKGARDLSRRELAVLRGLLQGRDVRARGLERSTWRVVGIEQLLGIAQRQATSG